MSSFLLPRPTHLSIFVTDPDSGLPVARLPLYAEVAVPRIVPAPPPETRLREPSRAAFNDIEPNLEDAARERIERELERALARLFDQVTRDALVADGQRAAELIRDTLRFLLEEARGSLAGIAPADLPGRIDAALRRAAERLRLELAAQPVDTGARWAEPLGVLATDHVGYASFDLKRLRPEVSALLAATIAARRSDPAAMPEVAIWIYPYGQAFRVDALQQGRFAFDAVAARLSFREAALPASLRNLGPRSLQNPSLTDWRLSPSSFAASPKTLVGANGCEELVPANLALQEFVLRQVVRLSDVPAGWNVPAPYKPAYLDEYRVSWYSLGHSLGEILYSLPLAPGETVKLAVIDWSWDSLTKRDETTKLTEELLHRTHRDRTITETVQAALRELQRGSSFMGGVATSVGASGSYGGFSGAAGNAWSLGGSTSTSAGSRELAAENVQRLSDSFSQASSSTREIQSTVVIQARQEEKESIQTRTFTNYNHSHTLTVLYYEVLRHFRVTVSWVRRRPAVLVQLPARIAKFDEATLLGHRFLLEPALLDASLRPAFDILERQEGIREHQNLHGIAPSDAWTAQWWEGDIDFALFEFGLKTAEGLRDKTDELVRVVAITIDGVNIGRHLLQLWEKGNPTDNVNVGERLDDTAMGWFVAKAPTPIKWRHLQGFEFELHDDDEWRMDRLAIKGLHGGGEVVLLENADVDYYFPINGASNTVTHIRRPGPPPPALAPANRAPEKSLTLEERHLVNKLLDHFSRNADHYNRAIALATDPTSIAIQFEGKPWLSGKTLADAADPTPLEVFGTHVAYPLARDPSQIDDTWIVDLAAALDGNDPARRQWALDQLAKLSPDQQEQARERVALASAISERLITLPTRGVFAEGKLGHCNISEEIDNTRFWKWEEHPIPIQAPDIAPATPIQPQPQQTDVSPTPFPQSLVNIVNPTAAPDPVGLGAALKLLGTPNIFRDMSGRAEVVDLLKNLSDNTIDIAGAAGRAREIQSKHGAGLLAAPVDSGFGSPGGTAMTPPSPGQTRAAEDRARLDNLAKRAEIADRYLQPSQKGEFREALVQALSKDQVATSATQDYRELLFVARTAGPPGLAPGVRLRKSHRSLTTAEWTQFMDAVRALQAAPGASGVSRYQEFVDIHTEAMNHGPKGWGAHTMLGFDDGRNFLAWHREYLIVFEEALIAAGGIPIPYWDWYSELGVPSRMDVEAEITGMGVTREWDKSKREALRPAAEIEEFWSKIVSSQYKSFLEWQEIWERRFHNTGHRHVGGDMFRLMSSPKDPIFWMHHSFVDKLWADLQALQVPLAQPPNPSERLEPAAPASGATPTHPFTRTVKDVIDHVSAGRYTYEELFRMPTVDRPAPGTVVV